MNISVFGLGYVGCVTSACLAENGNEVIGVDINPKKVEKINDGIAPIEENGVQELLEKNQKDGSIYATREPKAAIKSSNLSIICVGTPLGSDGQLQTTNIYNVIDTIAGNIGEQDDHTILIRSTVPPSTTRQLQSYISEKIPKTAKLTIAVNPEFLREGTAVSDFYDPPYTVIGHFEGDDITKIKKLYESLPIDAETHYVEPETAEALKMTNNAFHALKICFANEIGSIASQHGIDGRELMEMVAEDKKLNISDTYLDPGFAFGGSCLPKDSQAISTLGQELDSPTAILQNITESNNNHIERIADRLDKLSVSTIGIAGVAFKEGTTDMRNSPSIELYKMLDTESYFYSNQIDIGNVLGSNRDYVNKHLPDLRSIIFQDPASFTESVDAIVFTNNRPTEELVECIDSQIVCDPVGILRDRQEEFDEYLTISW